MELLIIIVSSTEPWNYALNLQDIPKTEIYGKRKNPFSHEMPSSQIRIKAKRVKEWEMVCNSAGPVPDSPVSSTEKEEQITLIPYGATALRISVDIINMLFPICKQAL